MNGRTMLWAIGIIWFAVLALMAMFLAFVSVEPLIAAVVMVLLAAAGVGGTLALVEGGVNSDKDGAEKVKAKRDHRERLNRLLESFDEDEIIELETLLLAREEEATQRPR